MLRRTSQWFRFTLAFVGALTVGVATAAAAPHSKTIGHVFIIVLENKGYDTSFGPESPARYLWQELPARGALLTQYHGIGHNSLDNYIAMISGQGPNPDTQADCGTFGEFQMNGPLDPNGQAIGRGCVYPVTVPTLAGQLEKAGFSWRGYMEDMGKDPQREPAACAHPAIGAKDITQHATAGDQYATKHNPFVYFHGIVDNDAHCSYRVVNLNLLKKDLRTLRTTANFTFITPNLCNDGHDRPCANGDAGGLVSADSFLRQWVPKILASPAYRRDGILIVTFDESDGPHADSTACCGEGPAPNAEKPGLTGPGGGRIGAVLLSPFITPKTVSETPHNHYALLRSIEDWFGLGHLGFAGASDLKPFGTDVFGPNAPAAPSKLH